MTLGLGIRKIHIRFKFIKKKEWRVFVMDYSIEEIKNKLDISIGILFKNDSFLLRYNANERSVSHKLVEYLQVQFPDWNVDCEYNRNGLYKKELEGISECSKQRNTDRIFPDIIIHLRNTNKNLLVIEIKTKNQDSICDIRKLELFTSQNGEYRYILGAFIKFNQLNDPVLRWFEDGQEI